MTRGMRSLLLFEVRRGGALLGRQGWLRTLVTSAARGDSEGPKPLLRRKDTKQTGVGAPFVDRKEVQVRGGNGGDGCISLAHIFANENAGPDGGDGGNGGHIFFKSTSSIRSLAHLSSITIGTNGGRGGTCNCSGKNGEHTIVQVPLGTIMKDPVTKEKLKDLNTENELFLAARGGCGGKGNKFFATPENQSPEIAEYGGEGEVARYLVELATIAEFGFVGFPNAGKSTLLRAITRARPKVASYPFTTTKPHVGVVMFDDLIQVRVADTPGLIEDAHLNRGLGIHFLRHIERCLCLVYVIDFSVESPWDEYETLRSELRHYDISLLARPFLVVANKFDTNEAKQNLSEFKPRYPDLKVFPISAKYGANLKDFLTELRRVYDLNCTHEKTETVYNPVRFTQEVRKWR